MIRQRLYLFLEFFVDVLLLVRVTLVGIAVHQYAMQAVHTNTRTYMNTKQTRCMTSHQFVIVVDTYRVSLLLRNSNKDHATKQRWK